MFIKLVFCSRYGETVCPVTKLGKTLVIICTYCGILWFTLPVSILGSGMALQIQEKHKRNKYYRTPAIKLIQSVWRKYAINRNSDTYHHWKLYRRKDGQPLTAQDKNCIRFIINVASFKQRQMFRIIIGVLNNDVFKEKSRRELLRRLQQTEEVVKTIALDLSKTLDKKHKIRDSINSLVSKLNQI